MHDIDQHGSRQRSTKSYSSRSASPLRGAAPYPKPYSHQSTTTTTTTHSYRQPTSPSNNNTWTNRNVSAHQTNPSAWQQLVVGASSAAGTTAAVVSEESMKCMKYCLNWLQYAMQHIEQQMGLIRAFLVSLATSQSSASSSSNTLSVPTSPSPSVLSAVKKDVVDTLRKVVDIISRYAGSSLPYHAKVAVRGFILSLPGRWASLNDIRSTTTSPAASPMLSASSSSSTTATTNTTSKRSMDGRDPHLSELPKHEETALRLLNFGQESVEMLGSISSVFSGTVDRAEVWIDRLRLRPPENNLVDDPSVQLPPIHTLDPSLHHHHHQQQQRQPSSLSYNNNNHFDHLTNADIPSVQQQQQYQQQQQQMDIMN